MDVAPNPAHPQAAAHPHPIEHREEADERAWLPQRVQLREHPKKGQAEEVGPEHDGPCRARLDEGREALDGGLGHRQPVARLLQRTAEEALPSEVVFGRDAGRVCEHPEKAVGPGAAAHIAKGIRLVRQHRMITETVVQENEHHLRLSRGLEQTRVIVPGSFCLGVRGGHTGGQGRDLLSSLLKADEAAAVFIEDAADELVGRTAGCIRLRRSV
mmetsp:Transcript_15277/g.53712  ORF Transcript_15277/g.53712 Transcript_15277/m.53712 type:complete len:214 (+) Transcript_15277:934-1575(+)